VIAWNTNRWLFWLALAGSLHGVLLLGRGCAPSGRAPSKLAIADVIDATELGLTQDPPRPPPAAGLAPGGGAIQPQPGARVSAPEQPVKPSAPTRLIDRAAQPRDRLQMADHREDTTLHQSFATDWLASDEADTRGEVRLHAARRQLLADKRQIEPPGAPDAASQVGSRSSSFGTGFGANGGPGGLGHGKGRVAGLVDEQFAFGGPAGAFRADVCFIAPTVRLLSDITTCTPVATFFTSVLNVTPRRFDRGFPGLGRRTEWFAIKYRGKFRVGAEDSYTFRLLSDDGARLEIDGQTVLENDGQHLPIAVSRNIRLDVGVHDFFVFYYQGPPDFVALQLFVKRFAHDEQLFGPAI